MSADDVVNDRGARERAAIEARLADCRRWYHRIELAPGVVTPGSHDSPAALRDLDAVGLPRDCAGLRVLDVGSRDGFFAFEMERRGAAEVVAVDYVKPTVTGFSIAADVLGSNVSYRTENAYDVDPERHGTFDVVLFLGILYHLRNPLLALDRVRCVMRPGARLFIETQLAIDPALRALETPAWQFFARNSLLGDPTNKWAPNLAGLTAVVEETGVQVTATRELGDRACLAGVAIEDAALSASLDRDYSVGALRAEAGSLRPRTR